MSSTKPVTLPGRGRAWDADDDELATLTHIRVLAGIRAAGEELEAQGAEAEAQRTLPAPSVEILRHLGVFWLKTPQVLGGTPTDPLQFSDVIEELAYREPSAAWAAMIGAGSTGMAAGWLPEGGAEEVFLGGGARPIFASQPQPRGVGRPVPGGFVVNGHWTFASGIRHADWLLGAFRSESAGDPTLTAFVVPKHDVTVIDNWHVAGLQGTGSADFVAEDVFVPTEHTYDRAQAAPWRGGPLFQQELRLFVGNELPPFCIGMARRAIDDMVGAAAGTSRGMGGADLSDRPVFQREVGLAEVRVRAAQLFYRDAIATAWDATKRGEEVSERHKLAAAAAQTYVAETCAEVVSGLFRYGGGRVLALSHPMQRHLRNAMAVRQHVAATEEHYEVAGRERLGRRGIGPGPAPAVNGSGTRA